MSIADSADSLLRRHGIQVTAQRLAMLDAVARQPHATADQLADDVRSKLGSISRQAVYDTLSALSDAGIVRRIQPAGPQRALKLGSAITTTTSFAGTVASRSTLTARLAKCPASLPTTTTVSPLTKQKSSIGAPAPTAAHITNGVASK